MFHNDVIFWLKCAVAKIAFQEGLAGCKIQSLGVAVWGLGVWVWVFMRGSVFGFREEGFGLGVFRV